MESMQARMTRAWYSKYSWVLLLWPLSIVFLVLVFCRRVILRYFYQGKSFSSPVVVVGNISVGGSGKTPLIISLANELISQGLSVSVVSRGYGATSKIYPMLVEVDSLASDCGDEPLLIRRSLPQERCSVVVDPDRRRAVNYAIEHFDPDLILCDDGLQHYRLHRDIEIAVIDGSRGFGNGQCLPSGPLREPVGRLRGVDFVVVNGQHQLPLTVDIDATFDIVPCQFRNLATGEVVGLNQWSGSRTIHALAAIGYPQRFSDTLRSLGFDPILQSFDDHQALTRQDLTFDDDLPVFITAKDAVKLSITNLNHVWVLDVEAVDITGLANSLLTAIDLQLSI
jgi:tetraacyldisaccharide 4'-kinase